MAAAYRKKKSLSGDFITLVFSKTEVKINHSDFLIAFERLERDPQSVSRITSDEDITFQLLTNFDLYATRLVRFFTLSIKHLSSSGTRRNLRDRTILADELIQSVLIPFLGENFAQFHFRQPFLDVFSCIIDFCLPFNPPSAKTLAIDVFRCPLLFSALFSGKTTGGIMRQFAETFTSPGFSYQVIRDWTRALIRQCELCPSSHDVENQESRWRALEGLLTDLKNALLSYSQQNRDKLKGKLELRADICVRLKGFGIETPTSTLASNVEMAIERLEKRESVAVLKAFSESFPCWPCHEISTDPSKIVRNDWSDGDARDRLKLLRFTDLLGEKIGMWNVLISAQALEDMQQAQAEESLDPIESTAIRLASGAWEQFSLRRTVGGKESILYLALYGESEKSGMLWQLDTEFDEEHDSLMQVIKVWRIGEIQVIVQSVLQIRLIHRTYGKKRFEACSELAIHEESQVNYPLTFGWDFDDYLGTLELDEKAHKRLAQSLMQFNKFCVLTKLTFKNIRARNLTAEYPLTLAREELDIVKDAKTSTLIQGRSGTGKTTCLVYKMFGRYLASKNLDPERPLRQVLVTRSHILATKLESYAKGLLATHNVISDSTKRVNNGSSCTNTEVKDTVFTIDSFPLVCTYNYFIKLLENTLRAADRSDFSTHSTYATSDRWTNPSAETPHRRGLYRRSKVVDFEIFRDEYWPSFPENLKKEISVTQAFMEIIGVIKGSACNLLDFRPLTQEEYCTRKHKLSSMRVNRYAMYDIYEHYEQTKKHYGDVDDLDRARNILLGISKNRYLNAKIEKVFDEIYVDEVQDQRQLELTVLLNLIKTPNAIHFAGDTAQSISKDSFFRFQSVKDLLYQRFSSAHQIKPKLCQLHKNYRTHQGILNIANSVMSLLYKRFRDMVDPMELEEGQFSGPKPTVFVGFDSSIFSASMFGPASLDANQAQLGADQVIIVRDSDQKRDLQNRIGNFALILTVLESKGMEFDDVLVYDFFTTTPCMPAFRAVESLPFDADKHIALCSELKQLYVAITRTQNRLWFFESSKANLGPILRLWDQKVNTFPTDSKEAREKLAQLRPGASANPRVWSARGYQFIEDKNYDTALVCFRRASDARGATLTKALISEKMAQSYLVRGNEQSSERYFREAIDFFHECNESVREAGCYEALGDFETAADIFALHGEFSRAADLYTQLGYFDKAANAFSQAGRYNDGASILASSNLFDNLVLYLSKYSTSLDPIHQRHYSRLCSLLLKRGKISPEFKPLAASALRTDAEKEEFFREYEMIDELASFLTERGRFLEASSLTITNRDLKNAPGLYEPHVSGPGQVVAKKYTKPVEVGPAKDNQLIANYAHAEPVVIVIQKMWRLRYPVVMKRREFFRSPAGQAITSMVRICQAVINPAPLHTDLKIRHRFLLFTDGLDLQLFAEKIRAMFKESRNEVKTFLETVDINEIESVQVKWEKLLEIQKKMIESTKFLLEDNWHVFPATSWELEKAIRKGYEKLRRVEFKLRLLNEREKEPAAAEAIQRVWRSRRYLLKHRRQFRESEAGQPITYVHRIVKALNARGERLDRKGEIRRAAMLFGQVVQLIREVKRVEKIFQNANRDAQLWMNAPRKGERDLALARKRRLAEIRNWVRKSAAFLLEVNWMQLNVTPDELQAKCAEAWRVMRAVENSLSHVMRQY